MPPFVSSFLSLDLMKTFSIADGVLLYGKIAHDMEMFSSTFLINLFTTVL